MTTIDLDAAADFMQTHARILDRRRFDLLFGAGDPAVVLSALDGYRNADGGYGWGLEPDLRATESEPGPALHAFEVLEEVGSLGTDRALALCDWLATATLADGGIPFGLPVARAAGTAPFWAEADATTSSLHITSAVAGAAHGAARVIPEIADHPGLLAATDYCMTAIAQMQAAGHALELLFSMQFLDAASDQRPDAAKELERLGAFLPADGLLHVAGGLEDEFIRPLDFAPRPDRPIRALFSADVIDRELERLAGLQQPDGGWPLEWASYSPAAALEWRGHLTVRALTVLQRSGTLGANPVPRAGDAPATRPTGAAQPGRWSSASGR